MMVICVQLYIHLKLEKKIKFCYFKSLSIILSSPHYLSPNAFACPSTSPTLFFLLYRNLFLLIIKMGSASSEILEVTDMEEVEVTEADAALLRELLEDESEGEELGNDRVKQVVHALEMELNGNSDDDKLQHDSLEPTDEEVKGEYCWAEMMAPNSPPVDETMAWYVDEMIGRAEFDFNIDFSQLYSRAFFEEETAYGCLWQH
ncbi:Uncharacterized protein TCM_001981 [Theobroma cacao]|uniref:Uncharacterized protein n=1 Tax=Theobroma cacao TaxID=3641 RepID=A0A061DT29_THECC|nr:Uncharacterized protein TCM_001981 [Theobroma cacao]